MFFLDRRSALRLAGTALLALGAAACGERDTGSLTVTILHTNDVHARVLPCNRFGTTCSPAELAAGGCYGGAARRATVVRRMRAEVPHLLLLDAGDQFQGTLFYNRFKGEAASRTMNHLGYDAMVVGNHELDDGPEVLARFAAALDFPLLGANVDITAEPSLEGLILPHLLTNIGGETLGVIGVVTEETATLSRPGPTIHFLPIEATLERVASELEAQGVKRLVVLSHAGLARDRRIAAAVPGIDVIVGGHTNTLLSNSAAEAEGPYPLVLSGPRREPVLIVQAHVWGMFLGRLDVTFDARGVLASWGGDVILLDDDVPEDEETAALVAELAEEVEAFTDVVVGETAVDLQGGEEVCRFAECNLGNLIADALFEAHPESEIALHNGGGIRASVSRGKVTVAQVLEVLPFGNTVSTFSLTGADLLATLEHGVSQAEDPDNEGTGRFLQVAGLRYAFTTETPPGERILEAEVRNDDGGFAPLEPERVYRIVANEFIRTGGDGFVVLQDGAIAPYDQGRVVADVVQDYLMEHSPVSPRVEGRIVRHR